MALYAGEDKRYYYLDRLTLRGFRKYRVSKKTDIVEVLTKKKWKKLGKLM